ncbi:MAG: hypothetical protein IPI30_21770 [Saprospiraceae bacterium]|nr:hypothetical protein [Candidatus Vicinibacter affinis]
MRRIQQGVLRISCRPYPVDFDGSGAESPWEQSRVRISDNWLVCIRDRRVYPSKNLYYSVVEAPGTQLKQEGR